MELFLTNVGAATLFFFVVVALAFILDRLWRVKGWRMFWQSFRNLTYGKRRKKSDYESLARNGYIYGWVARLLTRYKAVDK